MTLERGDDLIRRQERPISSQSPGSTSTVLPHRTLNTSQENSRSGASGADTGPGLFAARTGYGVTLAGGAAVIVRARRAFTGRIRSAAAIPAEAAAWRQWLLDRARPDILLAGCVTAQESLTMWLPTPFASIPKAEKVLPSLLDVQLPFPLESCHYRFVDIRRTPDGATRALAVVARLENLEARLEAYRGQGLDPVLLDHEGLALWTQSREEWPLPADVCRVILHVDLERVTLVIGRGDCYGNAYSVQATLPAAEGSFDRAVLAGLVGRLQRILRAEMPAETRIHWLACGPGARNAALIDGLHRDLSGEWPGALAVHREPESFLARALATRALARGPLRCNLRTHGLAHPLLLRRLRARSRTTAWLLLAAGLLVCGLNLGWRLLAARRAAGVRQDISRLAAELAPGAKIQPGQEIREVKKIAAQRAEREAPFRDAFDPSLAGVLAKLIREGKAQDVAYETLALQRNGFALNGTADDWDRCERLAARLKAPGYAVKLERQETAADTRTRFSIKGTSGP